MTTNPSDRAEQGSVTLEFALVSVVFLVFVWGILTFGVVFAANHGITHAATEAARASLAADASTRQTVAAASVLDNLDWLGPERVSQLLVTAADESCSYAPVLTCLRVTVQFPYGDNPVVPELPGFGLFVPGTLRAEAVVQVP